MEITVQWAVDHGYTVGDQQTARRRAMVWLDRDAPGDPPGGPDADDLENIIAALGGRDHEHPRVSRLRARQFEIRCVGTRTVAGRDHPVEVYEATVTYEARAVAYSGSGLRGIVYILETLGPNCEWSSEPVTVSLLASVAGNRIMNVVGEPFDPPLEITVARFTLTVVAPITSSPPAIASLLYTVNSADWPVDGGYIPAGWGLLTDLRLSEWQQGSSGYWRGLTYRVSIRSPYEVPPYPSGDGAWGRIIAPPGEPTPSPWDAFVLNAGMHAIDQQTGAIRRAFAGAHPAAEPVPLDENGREIAPGGRPVWIRFATYPRANWSALPRPL